MIQPEMLGGGHRPQSQMEEEEERLEVAVSRVAQDIWVGIGRNCSRFPVCGTSMGRGTATGREDIADHSA